jgi:hypothetical protein
VTVAASLRVVLFAPLALLVLLLVLLFLLFTLLFSRAALLFLALFLSFPPFLQSFSHGSVSSKVSCCSPRNRMCSALAQDIIWMRSGMLCPGPI